MSQSEQRKPKPVPRALRGEKLFLLTPPAHTFVPVDVARRFVLVCDYTGKEVVECKVLMEVVDGAKDQVRWLRLRAVALSGAFQPRGWRATARTLPVS